MFKKILHTWSSKILGQYLSYIMNVISRQVPSLGFIGAVVADMVCTQIPLLIFIDKASTVNA